MSIQIKPIYGLSDALHFSHVELNKSFVLPLSGILPEMASERVYLHQTQSICPSHLIILAKHLRNYSLQLQLALVLEGQF